MGLEAVQQVKQQLESVPLPTVVADGSDAARFGGLPAMAQPPLINSLNCGEIVLLLGNAERVLDNVDANLIS